ncbi:competence protein CoiA family protein [Paenarthrobacter sp. NPDC057981]|uniref:competence protein CoiA family protein n=1 Tax=Paenarthrobacter sp. NPDC057981 TaxID=3346297 RepID=UPI0036DE7A82
MARNGRPQNLRGLPPEERRATRQELACLSCHGRAVFRAGQKRQPSFAARHRQDCRLVRRRWSAFKFLTERRADNTGVPARAE